MLRKVLGVIVGYLVMFLFVFITFAIAYYIMGADGAYESGSYDISWKWIASSIILGLVAAILGGMTCKAISKSSGVAKVLAGLVLVLGLAMAIPALMAEKDLTLVRPDDVSMMEAMQNAQQPIWMLLLNPAIGAIGVLIGSCLIKDKN